MNLQTRYLGLNLKSPLVAAASPLSRTFDGIRRLEDAGASAIVLFSLFAEQVTRNPIVEALHQFGSDPREEVRNFAPEPRAYHSTPAEYLELISSAGASSEVPIIASLNVSEPGEWVSFVPQLEQAGADALEINVYRLPSDPEVAGETVERQYLEIVRSARAVTAMPVAVKILPYFTSLGNFARSLTLAGADGLVLFNWLYQPDIDLVNLEVSAMRDPGALNDSRLPLHWTSSLFGRIKADLAVSGGLRNHVDVLKAIAAGGTVAMLASEPLRRGVGRFGEIEYSMTRWLERNGYHSLAQLRGSMSKLRVADPAAYARLTYIKQLQNYWVPARIVAGRK